MFVVGETDAWHMQVGAVVVLEPPPQGLRHDRFKSFITRRLHLAPQAQWRLEGMPFGLDAPVFVDDPEFDIDRHLRFATLDDPAGPAQLGELVGAIAGTKLPRDRPLWELWLVDGLADGRVAMVSKMHHALIDGVSGVDLSTVMFDLTPQPRRVRPQPAPSAGTRPGGLALVAAEAQAALARQWRFARFPLQVGRQAAVMARHLAAGTRAGLPMTAPRTPLNGTLTVSRHFAFSDVALSDVRRVKDHFGVKVNDVVLALVGGSLRSWLSDAGELPSRPLLAEVPVSLRTAETRRDLGTQVGTMFVSLGTDVADPVERLRAIAASDGDAKRLRGQLHAGISVADVLPPALIGFALRTYTALGLERRLPPIFSSIVSNVAGAPFDLYVAGARVTGIYPFGPLVYGSGLNVTAMSHGDRLDFGFLSCPDLVADPWAIADGVPKALAELAHHL